MPLLRKPNPESIRSFLASQAELGFTYESVGATRNGPPSGYVVDETRTNLGSGEQVFTKGEDGSGELAAVPTGLAGSLACHHVHTRRGGDRYCR